MGTCEVFNSGQKQERISNNKTRYIFPNGDYYQGQMNNGFPNGVGIRYTSDGRIRYQGVVLLMVVHKEKEN